MIYTCGIDVGSTYTKAVIVDENGSICGQAMSSTGFKLVEVSKQVFEKALSESGLQSSQISYIVATGFGRHMVPFSDA